MNIHQGAKCAVPLASQKREPHNLALKHLRKTELNPMTVSRESQMREVRNSRTEMRLRENSGHKMHKDQWIHITEKPAWKEAWHYIMY